MLQRTLFVWLMNDWKQWLLMQHHPHPVGEKTVTVISSTTAAAAMTATTAAPSTPTSIQQSHRINGSDTVPSVKYET